MEQKLKEAEQALQKALKAVDRAEQRVIKARKAIRDQCPHDDVEYYPDPAGDSSESFFECKRCGKSSSRDFGRKYN